MSLSRKNADWQLQASIATLQISQFKATVDFAAPSLGLQQLSHEGKKVAGHLLGVAARNASSSAETNVSDVFTRGEDLVATYLETDNRPYSLEIYWRATFFKPITIFDLILSLETSHLESFPAVTTTSQLTAEDAWLVPADETSATRMPHFAKDMPSQESSCIVLRPEGVDWSYAEMTTPNDEGKVHFDIPAPGQIVIQRDLGGTLLEKGVVRRLRLRGAIVPRKDDLQSAQQLLSELTAEAPPLTA